MIDTARSMGYRKCVLASIYPQDLRVSSTSWIVSATLRWVEPGAIIVLHEGPGRERVIPILEGVLEGLRDREYRVTTVSDLLRPN
jgi:peptidyl-tRNA hydrolase